jgi:uroporphyrinogen III methyltransferase/synthase
MHQGVVYIVGAGPGDPGLMTVKGLARLRESDVVIHDRLINRALLDEAKRGAEIIDLGKQPGRSHQLQESINALLIAKAKEGRSVCRLKGGDPFIFGRGGEEAHVLSRAGIPFEIIPGVSCISAVPASAGIPLTHRDHAHTFMVVTACHASEKSKDWSEAAGFIRRGGTLIVLMGLARMSSIATALSWSGCSSSTPVAVISSGTLPNQETRVGTLENIASKVSGLQPPALIVIGSVVSLNISGVESKPTSRVELAGIAFSTGERR